MQRLNLTQADVERNRDLLREPEAGFEQPCPGSNLKLDDDIQWLGFIDARILWGHPNTGYFYAYAPDIFGDSPVPLDVGYVNDRAPADPNEPPLPIYPDDGPQQLAQQPGARDAVRSKRGKTPDASEAKRVLQKLLKALPSEAAKKLRAYVRTHKPELDIPEGA